MLRVWDARHVGSAAGRAVPGHRGRDRRVPVARGAGGHRQAALRAGAHSRAGRRGVVALPAGQDGGSRRRSHLARRRAGSWLGSGQRRRLRCPDSGRGSTGCSARPASRLPRYSGGGSGRRTTPASRARRRSGPRTRARPTGARRCPDSAAGPSPCTVRRTARAPVIVAECDASMPDLGPSAQGDGNEHGGLMVRRSIGADRSEMASLRISYPEARDQRNTSPGTAD